MLVHIKAAALVLKPWLIRGVLLGFANDGHFFFPMAQSCLMLKTLRMDVSDPYGLLSFLSRGTGFDVSSFGVTSINEHKDWKN